MVNKWLLFDQLRIAGYSCILCGNRNCQNRELCAECYADLPWLENACPRCSVALTQASGADLDCGACQANPPPFNLAKCLFAYQFPIDKLVTSFKFSAQLHLGRLFGELLADAMANHYAQRNDLPDCIIPVPLHRSRLRERGFNQAFELARFCSKRLGLPLEDELCLRHKQTRHQPGLKHAARRSNLRNAFSLNTSRIDAMPTRVLLLDDVMTTGTTLGELATQLRRAGTRDIHVWSIARALTD